MQEQPVRSFRPMSIVAKWSPISATAELLWKKRSQKSSRKVEICEVLGGTFATNFVLRV